MVTIHHVKLNVSNKDVTKPRNAQLNVRLYKGVCQKCGTKLNRILSVLPHLEPLVDYKEQGFEESEYKALREKESLKPVKEKVNLTAEERANIKAAKAAAKATSGGKRKRKGASKDEKDVQEPVKKKRKSAPKKSFDSLLNPDQRELLVQCQKELENNETEEDLPVPFEELTVVDLVNSGIDVYVHVAGSAIVPLAKLKLKTATDSEKSE